MPIDFKQMMRDYHIDFSDEVPGWINVECPICHHSGKRGFKGGFNIHGEYYNCWSCGAHFIEDVIQSLLSVNYCESKIILEKYSGHTDIVRKLNRKVKNNIPIKLPVDYVNERAKKYLKSRNYDPNFIIEKYKVKGVALSGPWSFRIIIPIYYQGNIVSYQGRSLFNKDKCAELGILRYKNLSIEKSWIDPKHILYNLDNVKKKD
jgi:DNA-directed RNA polymerase subunit RPC12/RpoP